MKVQYIITQPPPPNKIYTQIN